MLRAAIFDLDGVLVDTEQIWRDAEIATFASVGIRLDDELCRQTTGLRVEEVVAHWYSRWPWPETASSREALADAITDAVAERTLAAVVMPGAVEAVRLSTARGARLAVASSSPLRLIHAALEVIGLADAFDVCHSALDEEYGKPHPAVFMTTAAKLAVAPSACVVVEDSLNGVIAAKAARMRCVAVPDRRMPGFAVADAVLPDLYAFTPELWSELEHL